MNHDELFTFMYENYSTPYIGKARFEGEEIEFSGKGVCENSYVIVSSKYPRTIFFVGPVVDYYFDLQILIGEGCIDQIPTVTLPSDARKQMIAELSGREAELVDGECDILG